MSQPVVVIAEDEPLILRSLCFIVEHEGGRAVGVADGRAALAAVRRERPVLVVLDVMMPYLQGDEVCRQLRADPAFAHLPVVLLTALGQAEHERLALEAGATHYVRKPFDPPSFRDLVVGYLRGGGETSDGAADGRG